MLTCFSNTLSSILIGALGMTYLSEIIVMLTVKERHLPLLIYSIINALFTVGVLLNLIFTSVPYEEILLIALGSAALSMTVVKLGKGA
jgi:hypothetical protein